MTEYGFGSVSVVDSSGNLKGIFTDADLRRIITENGREILQKKLSDLSFKTPISLEKDALLNEAEEIFKKHSIDTILITDQGKPFGMLDIQDMKD
jgi:signal-transduction protein with cAMP-binding, CBS, and nucleotidyltransferase domain